MSYTNNKVLTIYLHNSSDLNKTILNGSSIPNMLHLRE